MRFVAINIRRITRLARNLVAFVAMTGAWMIFAANPAFAQGTVVNVAVCDATPAKISVTTPLNNSVFNQSTVAITGTIYRLTQIQVYVNDVYTTTVPLDAGATTFSTTVYIYEGTNAVKLVGVDPCSATGPYANLSYTYKPDARPTPQPTPGIPSQPVPPVGDSRPATGEAIHYMQGQVDTASQSPPASSLSNALYQGLVAVDLAPKNATGKEVDKMVIRAVLVAAGVVLLAAADPMIGAYHAIRYRMLKWHNRALPELVRHHAILTLRIVGVVLVCAAFLLLR